MALMRVALGKQHAIVRILVQVDSIICHSILTDFKIRSDRSKLHWSFFYHICYFLDRRQYTCALKLVIANISLSLTTYTTIYKAFVRCSRGCQVVGDKIPDTSPSCAENSASSQYNTDIKVGSPLILVH